MKNNTAMNFLNYIGSQIPLSDERCERTGQSPADGLLWFIGGGFGGWNGKMMLADEITVDYDEGETCWKFPDGSMVICSEDPSNFEYTEDIAVRYAGTVSAQMCAPWARNFRAGCGFTPNGEGLFRDGVYINLPEPEQVSVKPLAVVLPAPAVMIKQTTAGDLATNHAFAMEYIGTRQKDYDMVVQDMPVPAEGSSGSVPIFFAGHLTRLPQGSDYWGRAVMKGAEVVYFASAECYHAWVLRRFW